MGFSSSSRLKREDCKRTKHDSVFSQWEILIGPFDWEHYSLGKDGVEKYRLHNIPLNCSSPGLYELGVAAVHTDLGRDIRKLDGDRVVVVYLGQADNVRTRLQHYGRAGSHLDHGKSVVDSVDSHGTKGPGLFRGVFSRGFPIVFRWAPMENKKLAELTEARLLSVFDYAWNKGGNGVRRPDDIYLKLDRIVSSSNSSLFVARKFQKWLKDHLLHQKKEGIKIEAYSQLKNLKFRPKLVKVKPEVNETNPICALSLSDGSICTKIAIKGRKRCAEHKGKRNIGSSFKSVAQGKLLDHAMPLKEESPCSEDSIHEGKSWEVHAEKLVSLSKDCEGNLLEAELNSVCGVVSGNHPVCKNTSIGGRKTFGEHKGMMIKDYIPKLPKEGNLRVCGVGLGDGDICMEVPVKGRKRCAIHKGRRATTSLN